MSPRVPARHDDRHDHIRASWRSSSSSHPRVAASWNIAWNSVESICGTFRATHWRLNRCGTSKIGTDGLYPATKSSPTFGIVCISARQGIAFTAVGLLVGRDQPARVARQKGRRVMPNQGDVHVVYAKAAK